MYAPDGDRAFPAHATPQQMEDFYHLLREVSRTFALSIEQLPPALRDPFTIAYLLLRVSDTLEDHAELPAVRKEQLLLLWDGILAGEAEPAELLDSVADIRDGSADWRVVRGIVALRRAVAGLPDRVRNTVLRYVRETTRGMARWQREGPRVRTIAEMDDYMHQVAGLVGYMITDLFADYSAAIRKHHAELRPLGREFGLGLQTVNVIRGLQSDFQRGWVFVPETYLAGEGITASDLFDPAHQSESLCVVDRLANKAREHLDAGLQYVLLLPRREHRLRLMCIWPLLFAARTLAVNRGNPAALTGEAKITRAEVRDIMRNGAVFGWSNRWLAWYYRRLLRPSTAR